VVPIFGKSDAKDWSRRRDPEIALPAPEHCAKRWIRAFRNKQCDNEGIEQGGVIPKSRCLLWRAEPAIMA
jgi:hypothetical protein